LRRGHPGGGIVASPARAFGLESAMLKTAAALLVFLGGFALMVLEITGARYLAKDFGGAFYVWISQIGVILIALALGYAVGGALADRFKRARFLAAPLGLAGLFTILIPNFTPPLLAVIVMRHPLEQPIPALWQKLDPVLGSALVFLLPCFVLALLSPCIIRLAAREVERVGTLSGLVYAASTVGSIAGVFVSGFVLIDHLAVPDIFRGTGGLMILLAGLSLWVDRALARRS
jgi:MFS family permease